MVSFEYRISNFAGTDRSFIRIFRNMRVEDYSTSALSIVYGKYKS
jgi:hypothetical protein